MQRRRLRIALTRDRYPHRFNSPRFSRHDLRPTLFAPTHHIAKRIEAVTALPWLIGFDLVHAINRIPLGPTPFVVGFESHMPRYWWSSGDRFFRWCADLLKHERCRAIVAMSRAAAGIFRHQHANDPDLDRLRRKLTIIYPSVAMDDEGDSCAGDSFDPIRIAFVGHHFGRKGGCVAVRLAQKALSAKLPIHVTIVSKLQAGAGVWTDPPRPGFFDAYLRLLTLPNVTHMRDAPNAAVLGMLGASHFSLLTTFSDTFGYSAIESMARWTPVIATPQGALPEFITDGETGLMADLPVTPLGEWAGLSLRRDAAEFERLYAEEVDRLAEETLAKLAPLIGNSERIAAMRTSARAKALSMFDARRISPVWDALYEEAVEGPITVRDGVLQCV